MPKAFDDNTKKRINYLIEGERVKCIFVCLYLMGLRISELADFKMSDIRFRDHREDGHYWANITGKGQKVRTVPVSTECLDHIIAYRKAINVLAEPNPPVTEKPNREDQSTVILSLRKTKTGQFKALTANALHKVIKATFDSIYNELINGEFDHGEFVKIDPVLFKKASAHWMRHTSATHQSLDGTTLQELKVNLGHSSIETTTIYNSIDDENRAIKASKFKANKIVEEKS
jgi:site-specific recombinase XerD